MTFQLQNEILNHIQMHQAISLLETNIKIHGPLAETSSGPKAGQETKKERRRADGGCINESAQRNS